MTIIGYYDGMNVQIEESLQVNQKVVVIPIEDEEELGRSAAGGLHEYADSSLIREEKDMWRKAAMRKHV